MLSQEDLQRDWQGWGKEGDGLYDCLMEFSRAVTGATFFVPSRILPQLHFASVSCLYRCTTPHSLRHGQNETDIFIVEYPCESLSIETLSFI
jgi:hypothetical protein